MRGVLLLCLVAVQACSVSDADERQMGEDAARQVEQQLPMVTDVRVNAYITTLGREIASHTSRANLDWRFRVVNSADINAFALPGGFVYVNRGIIEQADRLDELAGVLGHEIGHVVERHSVDQMQKTAGANVAVRLFCWVTSSCSGTLTQIAINVAGSALLAKYSREDEIHADSQAVVNVVNAGIDPEGVPAMFGKLLAERKRNPNILDTFFASHPIEESRVQHTRALVSAYDRRSLQRLTRDDAAFHDFKRLVASLPAPPPPPRAEQSP